jgi:hypothetical protein
VKLAEAMADIVARLTAAGIRATLDGRDVNPPCVLVRPPTMTFRFGKGYWDADLTAWALVPDTGVGTASGALGELIDAVQNALGFAVVTARPDETTLSDGSTVPTYVLTWSQRIPA